MGTTLTSRPSLSLTVTRLTRPTRASWNFTRTLFGRAPGSEGPSRLSGHVNPTTMPHAPFTRPSLQTMLTLRRSITCAPTARLTVRGSPAQSLSSFGMRASDTAECETTPTACLEDSRMACSASNLYTVEVRDSSRRQFWLYSSTCSFRGSRRRASMKGARSSRIGSETPEVSHVRNTDRSSRLKSPGTRPHTVEQLRVGGVSPLSHVRRQLHELELVPP